MRYQLAYWIWLDWLCKGYWTNLLDKNWTKNHIILRSGNTPAILAKHVLINLQNCFIGWTPWLKHSQSQYDLLTLSFFYFVQMANRIFNTWMGDPSKVLLLETIVDVIAEDNLQQVVRDSGKVLMKGLHELQVMTGGTMAP